MKARAVYLGILLTNLAVLLAACASLPRQAKEAILRPFEPEEEPEILSARRAELLPQDAQDGTEEVWCVSVVYRCWSCPHGEWRTCISSYLARRIGSEWESKEMLTEEDWEEWEARDCPQRPEEAGETLERRTSFHISHPDSQQEGSSWHGCTNIREKRF